MGLYLVEFGIIDIESRDEEETSFERQLHNQTCGRRKLLEVQLIQLPAWRDFKSFALS